MDLHQITPLIVGAVVGALAKELASWAITTFKSLSFIATAKEKLKSLLTKENLSLTADLAFLSLFIFLLVNFARSPNPPTRPELLFAIGLIVGVITYVFSILLTFVRIRHRRLSNSKPRSD